VGILQLHEPSFYLHSFPRRTQLTLYQLTTAKLAAISHQPPSLLFTGWLSTDWVAFVVLLITIFTDLVENTVSNSNFTAVCLFVAAGTYIRSCLETGCETLLFICLLHSNGSTSYNILVVCMYVCIYQLNW
jgi:hypothetical protein